MIIPGKTELELNSIHPSQPDDGKYPRSRGPISVFSDRGRWIIRDGNHRFYRSKDEKGGNAIVQVRVTNNPHVDY